MNLNTNYLTSIKPDTHSNFISRFISSIIKKNPNINPTRIKTYEPHNHILSSDINQLSKDKLIEQFQSEISDMDQHNLLKKTNTYAILDSSKSKAFKAFSTRLLERGHPVAPPKYLTRSGIKVRTKIEKMCADYYTDLGLPFKYETIVIFFGYKKNFFKIPDFYFPNFDLFHEHFGFSDNSSYAEGMRRKANIYNSFKLNWFYTTLEDEPRIEDVLTVKLQSKLKT